MKKEYKQLRKKLTNKFNPMLPYNNGYETVGNVQHWVKQSGIKYNSNHLKIICLIFGSVPYPYQKKDRKKILKYLKNNKKLVV